MTDSPTRRPQVLYLGKVLAGVSGLAGLGLAGVWLRSAAVEGWPRSALLGLIVLVCLLLPWAVRAQHRRMDELQQRLHERACAFAVMVTLPAVLVAAVLGYHQVLPEVGPFWIALTLVATWALGLALADRHFNGS